jgi:hypothetical protein
MTPRFTVHNPDIFPFKDILFLRLAVTKSAGMMKVTWFSDMDMSLSRRDVSILQDSAARGG